MIPLGRRMNQQATVGYGWAMRIGNTEVRFLGGGLGCLTMILLSIAVSVILTVLVNLIL